MKFFKKKKNQLQQLTSRGGPGQRLDDSASPGSSDHVPSNAKDAAALALERRLAADHQKQAQDEARRRERQMKIEEERMMERQLAQLDVNERRELERKLREASQPSEAETKKKLNPVLYTSPLVNQSLIAGPAKEMFGLLNDSIAASTTLAEDDFQREHAARLFHTANSSQVKQEALNRIRNMIQKIVENPTESKYREIKRSHKLYADSVLPAFGAELFLKLIGFEIATSPEKGEVVRLKEGIELDLLPCYLEIFETSTKPLEMNVYRHAKVYFLSKDAKIKPIEVPEWTYHLTGEDVAAMQKEREREVEWWMTVCSKRVKLPATPFNVTVIRVRFSNGAIIEAMFGVHEFIKDIIIFVATLLDIPPESFNLKEAVGNRFDVNSTESIGEIRLVPSAVLHFSYNDPASNLPMPSKEHVELCQNQRELMTFVGVDISDYKF